MRPRIAVITFPGSLDDEDMRLALEAVGSEALAVWHADAHLPTDTSAVVVPGGFSYGDYLRCGAIAGVSPVMDAIREFAEAGGPVLGVCNGFQILCEAGLLPGVLRANRQLEYVCRDVTVLVDETRAEILRALSPGASLAMPIKHGEGNWYADEAALHDLAARGQLALRYTVDVNGSVGNVAGVCNERGNVLGLMPHPEHAVDPLVGSTGGLPLLEGLVAVARDRTIVPV